MGISYPAIRIMTRNGSLAIVKMNRANAGPKAMKEHPKNTAAVISIQLDYVASIKESL